MWKIDQIYGLEAIEFRISMSMSQQQFPKVSVVTVCCYLIFTCKFLLTRPENEINFICIANESSRSKFGIIPRFHKP